ncbi:restriction endonuclease subunit S [Clostridium perfringens]|uniref:restriction endonuclease subunit S n=1 Tax=Clostridium perfringens TaxID=1502 RepID=UPI0013E40FB0|nr:restriction endonuclease subunit S [Clostridium perfringens]NGT35677.1 hypothetical protein [Clostridium perfringens]
MKVSELFEVKYGVNLELNKCEITNDIDGINFVSRISNNNGVVAKVKRIDGIEPQKAGTISCAASGFGVLCSFIQTEPYYSGRDLYVLTPKNKMTLNEKLFYCMCLRKNAYKYAWNRQANKTLKDIELPDEIPAWVNSTEINYEIVKTKNNNKNSIELNVTKWKEFEVGDLFDIKRGEITNLHQIDKGDCPVVSAYGKNQGISYFLNVEKKYKNCLTASFNGSGTGYCAYHEYEFNLNSDCGVLIPKFEINKYSGIFLATIINKISNKYIYGRKLTEERLKKEVIKLPVDEKNNLDLGFMENYIKLLPYGDKI